MDKELLIRKLHEYADGCEKEAGKHAIHALEVKGDKNLCEVARYQALLLKGRADGIRDAITEIRLAPKEKND